MKILFQYLKKQKKTVFVALLLATINQCFSLLDPWVTGHVVDEVIIPIKTLTKDRFLQLAML